MAALAVTAVASAGERPGKPAKPETSKAWKPGTCHKKRAVLLRGTFVRAGVDAFTMNVVRANRHGRALLGEQTVKTDARTKIRRKGKEGKASLADLVENDRVKVMARCRPGETAGSVELLARHVKAHPPKPANAATGS
ncbi:MAG TPA: hypothetical protein VG144_06340 [Gaiellaceae bacterium]|nr:hypothetical protein [Gaiellaceae bacterium]